MDKSHKEKSKWFYTEHVSETKAVVLLAHGLNLKASKMDELALFFNAKKCDVLRISLGVKPKRWEELFEKDYEKALEHARILERPLYFVGYSLGALLGLSFIDQHPNHEIKSQALFAPPLFTRKLSSIPILLSFIFTGKSKIPSLNLPTYRYRSFTTLEEYKIFYFLQKKIRCSACALSTQIILDPKDELIDGKRLIKFAELNPLWKTLCISKHNNQLPIKYHHLIIDRESTGALNWEKILQNLSEHFSL
ncbi:MAG: alpha/beta hydrolase [Bacteriovorax sp.]|nr:alpha/beta hydrolase [Bacteriovorax sp.]